MSGLKSSEQPRGNPSSFFPVLIFVAAAVIVTITVPSVLHQGHKSPVTTAKDPEPLSSPNTTGTVAPTPDAAKPLSPEESCTSSDGQWCNDQCYQSCSQGQQFFCAPRPGKEPSGCIEEPQASNYSFTSYSNAEPYYSAYCNKIDPYDLSVRTAAAEAIRPDSGAYSVSQLLDIYDWVKGNIEYQSSPLAGIPYPANETLITKSGDCKNQAVLIASMVDAIGGTAKVVADPSCEHAYALVFISNKSEDKQKINEAIDQHYHQQLSIHFVEDNKGKYWLIFDPAGGYYPGNTLPACSGNRTVYEITSCMACAQLYPNAPFTFNDSCYSQCPQGTIAENHHLCVACPTGEYSYQNHCVSCPTGYYLTTNGRCYAG